MVPTEEKANRLLKDEMVSADAKNYITYYLTNIFRLEESDVRNFAAWRDFSETLDLIESGRYNEYLESPGTKKYHCLSNIGVKTCVIACSITLSITVGMPSFLTWNSDMYKDRLACAVANGNNYDYWAIEFASKVLAKRSAKHKILIVLSDGAPCGCNNVQNAVKATAESISMAKHTADVVGIAIAAANPTVYRSMYGENIVFAAQPSDIYPTLQSVVKNIVRRW